MMAERTILCYGDSNTYGHDPVSGLRYPPDIRWTGRLGQILGPGFRVIEEGCNGRTTMYDYPDESWKNGLHYLRPCLNSHKPLDVVILMLGTNDLKEIFHAPVREIAENAGRLAAVIQTFMAEKQGAVPQIILVAPPRIGPGITRSPFADEFTKRAATESEGFSGYYRQEAERRGCVFFDAAQYVQPSREDSLHLTPEAHAALAEGLGAVIKEIQAR